MAPNKPIAPRGGNKPDAGPKPSLASLCERAAAAEADLDWPAAIAVWADARRHYPQDRTGWMGGAMARARSGNIDAGLALIDEAAKRFPGDAPVIAGRGHIVEMRGDPAASAAAWQSVRAKAPGAPDGWVRAAMLLADAGKVGAAVTLLDDGLRRHPGLGLLRVARAHLTARDDDPEALAAAWAIARDAAPGFADGWIHGGLTAIRAGDLTIAAQIMADGVGRFPHDAALLSVYAHLAEHQNDLQAAMARWQAVLDLNPTHAEAAAGLARVSARAG